MIAANAWTTVDMALSANLVADNARTATSGGYCAVCRREVRRGERIADLAAGGLVHVARCSSYAGTA